MSKSRENFLSFQFSLFLDDHTSKLRSKRRFSEHIPDQEFKKQINISPLKIKKRERLCSIETCLESKKSSFSLANFYPRFERFASYDELSCFTFTTKNSLENEICEKISEEVSVESLIKKKLCKKITKKLSDILKLRMSN